MWDLGSQARIERMPLQLKCGILCGGPREVPSILFVSLCGRDISVLTEGWGRWMGTMLLSVVRGRLSI